MGRFGTLEKFWIEVLFGTLEKKSYSYIFYEFKLIQVKSTHFFYEISALVTQTGPLFRIGMLQANRPKHAAGS